MINSILPAIVGTSLKALGQERNQSDSGLAKQISSKKYIDMAPQDMIDLKVTNRKKILDDHTYKNRVQEFLSL